MSRYYPRNGETIIENFGVGDGVTTTYSGNLGFTPVAPGSVLIRFGNTVIECTREGNLTLNDKCIGWVNYKTGQLAICLANAPENNVCLRVSYRYVIPESRLYRMETDNQGRIILIPVQAD